MRQLKFIPLIMQLCQTIAMVHKNDLEELMNIINYGINIVLHFIQLEENRTYMILTNKLFPLIDLLVWCLNRPTKFVYSLSYVPSIFYILNRHIKHTLNNPEYRYIQTQLVEYIFSSPMILRLKQKFLSFNGGLDLSTAMGKVPLALLKSIAFLETLTNFSGF